MRCGLGIPLARFGPETSVGLQYPRLGSGGMAVYDDRHPLLGRNFRPVCQVQIRASRKEPSMAHEKKNSFYLPRKGLSALAKGLVGKLRPALVLDEGVVPFAIWDSFDQSLRRSGRLLLEIDGAFELVTSYGETILQSAERSGDLVADFRDGAVKRDLKDISPLRSLRPIGSGTLRRGTLALLDREKNIKCRANIRVLAVGGAAAAVVTLQGMRGHDKSLANLRKNIADCGGETLSRSGLYADLWPGHRALDAKPEVIVAPGDTAFQVATDIIADCIAVARATEHGIIEDHDTECLHDYRIAVRKIRSVLGLFKGVYREDQTRDLKARFSALMQPTGLLRDLDVYLLGRQHFYELLPKSLHGGLDSLFQMVTALREAERVALARHLASAATQYEIKGLTRLFDRRKKLRRGPNADQGAYEYACRLIWKRYRKISDKAKRIGPDTEDREIHLLRIQCKKLRYLMEFFGPLFPRRDFKALIRPLKALQENLGLFNDYSVQQASLHRFLSAKGDLPDSVNRQITQSVDALIAVLHRKQKEERVGIVGNIAQIISPETQQTFRKLFHRREGKKRNAS